MSDDIKPMPKKLAETSFVLKAKMLIEVDEEDGEDFYAYELIPDTEEYKEKYPGAAPIEVYVAVNKQSTSEFNELQIGSKFKMIPGK